MYKPVRGSPTPPPEEEKEYRLTLMETWGAAFEFELTKFFTRWGTVCSRYPVPIIIVSVGIALGLTTGVHWLTVSRKKQCRGCGTIV